MTDHRVAVQGADLFVVEDGRGTERALLLLSGARCTTRMWTPVMDRLSARFHVARFDIRGTGRSVARESAEYGLDRYADDAAVVLEHLQISRAVVWGMAFGARVALAFASRHPEMVTGLALYDASVEAPDPEAQRDGAAAAARRRAELGLPEPARDPAWFAHDDERTLRRSLAATYRDPDHRRYVEGVAVPVLVATGDHDPNLGPSRRLADRIEGAELTVLEAVGHGSVLARPELCTDVFLDFVDRRCPGGAGQAPHPTSSAGPG